MQSFLYYLIRAFWKSTALFISTKRRLYRRTGYNRDNSITKRIDIKRVECLSSKTILNLKNSLLTPSSHGETTSNDNSCPLPDQREIQVDDQQWVRESITRTSKHILILPHRLENPINNLARPMIGLRLPSRPGGQTDSGPRNCRRLLTSQEHFQSFGIMWKSRGNIKKDGIAQDGMSLGLSPTLLASPYSSLDTVQV